MKKLILALLFLYVSLNADVQTRTFNPSEHKFYAGIAASAWWRDSTALCGVQLHHDCWGKHIAYVEENSKAANFICSTLLSAKMSGEAVEFVMDVSNQYKCEITQVVFE